ncbi:hypothetical protein IV203_003822 [Nitzschia inconspicua]|uniref:Uncharacterized protein n=1 Tax=Nitzschia inconspicua TaxID=303405 RepID=A0A9K3L466_9STRA|nr:hypothetical protein IV203_003822 [Nitzschia inconspicua]
MTINHFDSSPSPCCTSLPSLLWEASIRNNIQNETPSASFAMPFSPSLPCIQQQRALKELLDILDEAIEIADEGTEMCPQQRKRRSRSRQPQQTLSNQDRKPQP